MSKETIYSHWWHKIDELVFEIRENHPNFNQMKYIDSAIQCLIDARSAISSHEDVLEAMD